MKVRFVSPDGPISKPTSGKGRFMGRLTTVFKDYDIEPVYDLTTPTDIDFHITKFHYGTNLCKKRVLRLGPAQIDTNKDIKYLNRKKKYAIKRVDGVIYQSEFARNMCNAILGPAVCPSAVIFNGAIPWDGPAATSPHKINFFASARKWTKQKRLFNILEAFMEADIPDSAMFIAGNIMKAHRIKGRNIYYTGMISDAKLFALHKLCHAMVHIVWLDACPNGVVEALVNGCPVITNDWGGTHELGVQTIIPDTPWNFKPVNLNKTPKLSVPLLAEAMKKHAVERVQVESGHLHIKRIAEQYSRFFRSVLDG
jgi:glycosyltransferase involved in cell wall biosynthesis